MVTLTGSPALKVQVMCEGIRYTAALGAAAAHSMPNYYPYRFKDGEHDPTGRGIATIPYLINTGDETEIRILGNGDSPWHVEGDVQQGYVLIDDRSGARVPIAFEPLRPWLTQKTADGLPFAQAGVTTHGDMLVINVAPGCEYFLHKHDGQSMRCAFCAYGAPDERTKHLGQIAGRVETGQPGIGKDGERAVRSCASESGQLSAQSRQATERTCTQMEPALVNPSLSLQDTSRLTPSFVGKLRRDRLAMSPEVNALRRYLSVLRAVV